MRQRQSAKAEGSIRSTDFGISIRFKFDEANADDSIRINLDDDSNVIVSNDLHSEKHRSHIISPDFGITTNFK
jgi:hypothetical protein